MTRSYYLVKSLNILSYINTLQVIILYAATSIMCIQISPLSLTLKIGHCQPKKEWKHFSHSFLTAYFYSLSITMHCPMFQMPFLSNCLFLVCFYFICFHSLYLLSFFFTPLCKITPGSSTATLYQAYHVHKGTLSDSLAFILITAKIEDQWRMNNPPTFHGFAYSRETSDDDDPNDAYFYAG